MPLQLSMSITNTQIGTQFLDHSSHFCKTKHPVMYEEDLTASFAFVIYRVSNKVGIEHLHLRLYGLPVGWRRIDNTEVTCTHKTELKRSWNRRCSKCEAINIRA